MSRRGATERVKRGAWLLVPVVLALVLRLEGQPLALRAPVQGCMVAEKERSGYIFHCRLDLTALPGPDLHIIGLFISKGRGSPVLSGPVAK